MEFSTTPLPHSHMDNISRSGTPVAATGHEPALVIAPILGSALRGNAVRYPRAHVKQHSRVLADTPGVIAAVHHEAHTAELLVRDTGCARHCVDDTDGRNTKNNGLSRYCYETILFRDVLYGYQKSSLNEWMHE